MDSIQEITSHDGQGASASVELGEEQKAAAKSAKLERRRARYKEKLASMSPGELNEFRRKESEGGKRVRERYSQPRKDEIREQSRRRCADQQEFLPEEELPECIKDPRKALTIRGDEWIVCLRCRQLVQVIGIHLRHMHPDLTLREYKDEFGYDYKSRLCSKAFTAKKRAKTRVDHLGDLTTMRERAEKNFGPARAKRKGQRKSLVARLNQSERMKRAKPQRKGKVSEEEVIRVFALNLPLADSAKLLRISTRALYSRAQRLGLDTAANHRVQRLLISYCGNLRGLVRASRSPISVGDVVDWHVDQMRLGNDDLFQKTAAFLPNIRTELEKNPEWLEELAQDSSAEGAVGRVIIGLASRILRRVNDARPGKPKKKGRRPGMLDSTVPVVAYAAALALNGFTLYAMAPFLYPGQSRQNLAYKSVMALFHRHEREIEAEKARLLALDPSEREKAIEKAKNAVNH